MINIWYMLLLSIGLNLVMFIPAYIFQTDKLTDISYALTFILLSLTALFTGELSTSKIVAAAMVCLWGLRLGGFLFYRILQTGKDKRFDEIRNDPLKFIHFWALQGVSVWVVLMSFNLYMGSETVFSIAGIFIWLTGLIIEAVADQQKYNFRQKKTGKWIDTGLWHYSRHPNYFGEILCWTGMYIYTFTSLSYLNKFIALISPVYITVLLLFVSGIPRLEEYADNKWGDNKKYQKYKKNTNILIPWFK